MTEREVFIAALQKELCAEYHNEIRVTLKD